MNQRVINHWLTQPQTHSPSRALVNEIRHAMDAGRIQSMIANEGIHVETAIITITTLQIGTRDVTAAIFNQLEEGYAIAPDGRLYGEVLGWVNDSRDSGIPERVYLMVRDQYIFRASEYFVYDSSDIEFDESEVATARRDESMDALRRSPQIFVLFSEEGASR